MTDSTILILTASGRYEGSVTRGLSEKLASTLHRQTGFSVVTRDLAKGIQPIDDQWIAASFTDEEVRDAQQKQILKLSDTLIAELEQAKYIVIASPVYNFSVPSVLKAWIDQIARARKTFRYTENGPEGLLTGKRAYLVMASGGVDIGSEADFATDYLRFILGFVGIRDVAVVNGNALSQINDETALQNQLAGLAA